MEFSWQFIHQNFDWLGHIIEGLCIAVVVSLLGLALFKRRDAVIMALSFAAGHFHGREKRDVEIATHAPPPHLEAYNLWIWGWDQATDFWPVAAVMVLLVFIVVTNERILGPRGGQ